MLIFAVTRALTMTAVLLSAGRDGHRALTTALTDHDAGAYLFIAQHGYDHGIGFAVHGRPTLSKLAFLPLYPGLLRAVSYVAPSYLAAGLIVTTVAGFVAAVEIYLLAAGRWDRRVAWVLVALWAVQPGAAVLSMVYAEALFTALAAGALLALQRRRWVTAAVLCVLAGVTRPVGAALVVAVWVGVVLARGRRDRGRRALAALLAPLGLLGYYGFSAAWSHRAGGWLAIERTQWRTSFDGGRSTARAVVDRLELGRPLMLVVAAVVVLVVCALLVVLLGLWRRVPAAWLVYGWGVVVLGFGAAGYLNAKPRFVVPAFVVWYPLAALLARVPTPVTVVLMAGLAVVDGWWSGYLLTVWHWAI